MQTLLKKIIQYFQQKKYHLHLGEKKEEIDY